MNPNVEAAAEFLRSKGWKLTTDGSENRPKTKPWRAVHPQGFAMSWRHKEVVEVATKWGYNPEILVVQPLPNSGMVPIEVLGNSEELT